jgi:hypothetical protein
MEVQDSSDLVSHILLWQTLGVKLENWFMEYSMQNQILPKVCGNWIFYFNETWYNQKFVWRSKSKIVMSYNSLVLKTENT